MKTIKKLFIVLFFVFFSFIIVSCNKISNYKFSHIEWNSDGSGAKIYLVSAVNNEDIKEVVVTAKLKENKDATCDSPATKTYEITYDGETYTKKIKVGEALGHNYVFDHFSWSNDFKTAQAVLKCAICDDIKYEDAVVSSSVKTEATCTENGVTTYTATYDGHTESKDVADIETTGHYYAFYSFEWSEDFKTANAVLKCQNCDDVIKEAVEVSEAKTQNEDIKALWTYTYTATYGNHTETKMVEVVDEDYKYTVTFKNGNDVLKTYELSYDELPEYDGETPTKQSDNTYTYTFAGWDKEISKVSGDITYNALFDSSYIYYNITFKNGEDVLKTYKLIYDELPVYDGETPTKESDNTYTYTFAGWDKEISKVNKDVTYTATFTPEYIYYNIIFKNGNEELKTYKLIYGELPVYDGKAPVKEADNTYTYTFTGWDKEISNVSGDITYTATFEANYIDYVVKFMCDDTILSELAYHYGEEIDIPEAPVKAYDSDYYYKFKSWDKEIVKVNGDVTYNALFDSYERVSQKITLTSDLSKKYDGNPIIDPIIEHNGGGELSVNYKRDNDTSLTTNLPVNAGCYSIVIVASETEKEKETKLVKQFIIENETEELIRFSLNEYPNVELITNKVGKVIYQTGLDPDGMYLLDRYNFIDMYSDEALDLFMKACNDLLYIQRNEKNGLQITCSDSAILSEYRKKSNDYKMLNNIEYVELSLNELKNFLFYTAFEYTDAELAKMNKKEFFEVALNAKEFVKDYHDIHLAMQMLLCRAAYAYYERAIELYDDVLDLINEDSSYSKYRGAVENIKGPLYSALSPYDSNIFFFNSAIWYSLGEVSRLGLCKRNLATATDAYIKAYYDNDPNVKAYCYNIEYVRNSMDFEPILPTSGFLGIVFNNLRSSKAYMDNYSQEIKEVCDITKTDYIEYMKSIYPTAEEKVLKLFGQHNIDFYAPTDKAAYELLGDVKGIYYDEAYDVTYVFVVYKNNNEKRDIAFKYKGEISLSELDNTDKKPFDYCEYYETDEKIEIDDYSVIFDKKFYKEEDKLVKHVAKGENKYVGYFVNTATSSATFALNLVDDKNVLYVYHSYVTREDIVNGIATYDEGNYTWEIKDDIITLALDHPIDYVVSDDDPLLIVPYIKQYDSIEIKYVFADKYNMSIFLLADGKNIVYDYTNRGFKVEDAEKLINDRVLPNRGIGEELSWELYRDVFVIHKDLETYFKVKEGIILEYSNELITTTKSTSEFYKIDDNSFIALHTLENALGDSIKVFEKIYYSFPVESIEQDEITEDAAKKYYLRTKTWMLDGKYLYVIRILENETIGFVKKLHGYIETRYLLDSENHTAVNLNDLNELDFEPQYYYVDEFANCENKYKLTYVYGKSNGLNILRVYNDEIKLSDLATTKVKFKSYFYEIVTENEVSHISSLVTIDFIIRNIEFVIVENELTYIDSDIIIYDDNLM